MNTFTPLQHHHPVAVLGGGPVGLAAAAHLLEHGLEPMVFEAGPGPGTTLMDVGHVRLFSPWRYNIDDAAARLLDATGGWVRPDPDALPTAGELVREYLEPLAAHPAVAQRLRFSVRVTGVTRQGVDKTRTTGRTSNPFLLRVRNTDGETEEQLAAAVIDATGTWGQPNPLGANGLPALGEAELRDRISYGMPDVLGRERNRYAGRTVLVVGAGHSAAGTLLALADLADQHPATRIHWAVRGSTPHRVLGNTGIDRLPARGALGERVKALVTSGQLTLHTGFAIRELRASGNRISAIPAGESAASSLHGIDRIVAATGSRPDLTLIRELRVQLDPALESVQALAPLVDPNEHSCGTVPPHGHRELEQPETGFFIAGAKSYGRAPTFLMITGYEQVRSITAALAGDLSTADEIALEQPETGVCDVPEEANRVGTEADRCCPRSTTSRTGGASQPCCTPAGSPVNP